MELQARAHRKATSYVVGSAVANGLTWLQVGEGDAIELVRLQHFTSPAAEPSVSLVVDVCGKSLADVATYMEGAFESDAFAASKPPELKELLTSPQRKAYAFLELKDPEQVMREAQHQAKFTAEMSAGRQLHEEGHLAKDALAVAGLLEQLEQPAAEKAKEPRRWATCDHGRRKGSCKDCGTGRCKHGRQRGKCRDCGTGYCDHGRQKSTACCRDCGTGYCQHGRRKSQCKDCGTGARYRSGAARSAP
jgi:hypothetical protein